MQCGKGGGMECGEWGGAGRGGALGGAWYRRFSQRLIRLTFALSTLRDFILCAEFVLLPGCFFSGSELQSHKTPRPLLHIPPPTQFIVHTLTKSHHASLG